MQAVMSGPVRVRQCRIGVDDERDLAGQVVDDGKFLGEHEQNVGNVGKLRRGRRRGSGELRLDVPHGVVAEIAGETAAEARQTRLRRGAVSLQEIADERQRIAVVVLDDATVVLDFDLASARTQTQLRRQADERITAEALAADHRFQQERIALVGELEVQRQGRIEIREGLEYEGDAVISLRGKRAEFGFGHDAPTSLSTYATGYQTSLYARDAKRDSRLGSPAPIVAEPPCPAVAVESV